jgi:hypothetical protein
VGRYSESKLLARAVRRHATGLVDAHGQKAVLAVVTQVNPLAVELVANDIVIEDAHLMLGAWTRFYDQQFGISVGDTVLVSRLANEQWFVFDVLTTSNSPSVGGVRTLNAIVDGSGSVLETGVAGDYFIDSDCTITKWTLLADQVGDVVVDIWKVPFGSFPPDVGDSITAADEPTLSGEDHADDIALTGWTTEISAGDCLRFNIDSVSAITRLDIALTLE